MEYRSIETTGADVVEDVKLLFEEECSEGLCDGTGLVEVAHYTFEGAFDGVDEVPCPHVLDGDQTPERL